MDIHTSFTNRPAVNRMESRLVSIRMRNCNSELSARSSSSKANALWNIIEADDDENDVGPGSRSMRGISSQHQQRTLPSASSLLQQNSAAAISSMKSSLLKSRMASSSCGMTRMGSSSGGGMAMVKKGNQLYSSHSKLGSNTKLGSSSSVMRKSSSSSKYSYKLRNMLQSDLKMGVDQINSRFKKTSISSNALPSCVSPNSRRNTLRKTPSLQDEFRQDINGLLKSLRSTEFQGTIQPEHARYISDSDNSLM